MRRFWIFWFVIFSSVAVMNRITEQVVIAHTGEERIISPSGSSISAAETSRLADIARNTSYELPGPVIGSGNERGFAGQQKRNLLLLKNGGKLCSGVSVTSGFSLEKYKLTGGDYLNVSAPNDFFVFLLRKIRI